MGRNRESGYALLLVFLMAAVLAIGFYAEIPRVAFQSQRAKERLLVTRGQQYYRGIQVFHQAFPQQPIQKLEDLEEYQSRHFVRHKYVDPMTGKAEWRLIHMQGGVLTDSVLTKPNSTGQDSTSQNLFITPTTGFAVNDTQTQAKPQDRRRPSEGGAGGAGGGGADGQLPPIPGPVPDGSAQPGAVPQTNPGDQTGQAPAGQTGQSGQTPQPNPPAQAGSPGSSSGPVPSGVSNPAQSLINSLLTQPRQGPLAASATGAMNGVVGVASKAKAEGIMTYNDRTAYDEWEFIFDPSKVPPIPAPGSLGMGSSPLGLSSSTPSQSSQMQSGNAGAAAGMQSMFGGGGAGQMGQQGNSNGPSGQGGTQGTASAAPAALPLGYRPGRP